MYKTLRWELDDLRLYRESGAFRVRPFIGLAILILEGFCQDEILEKGSYLNGVDPLLASRLLFI